MVHMNYEARLCLWVMSGFGQTVVHCLGTFLKFEIGVASQSILQLSFASGTVQDKSLEMPHETNLYF